MDSNRASPLFARHARLRRESSPGKASRSLTLDATIRPAVDAERSRAQSCRLRYIDLHGNNCHHIGYRHPALVAALTDQLSSLPFNTRGFTNEPFVQLAEMLATLWPGHDGRVFLVPGGAAAIELALAIARVHTGRHKSISFYGSYHGRSFGAVSLSGTRMNRSPRLGPLLPGTLHVPSFEPPRGNVTSGTAEKERSARHSLAAIRSVLEHGGEIACVVAETIRNGGYRPPEWCWPEVRMLCDSHHCMLVFDEVPTGLGKTGKFFNREHFDVRPDITVIGKALGGAAMPAAALIADGGLDSAPELNLGYFTHEKNPLMARAALATLQVISDEGLVDRSRTLGTAVLERLQEICDRNARIVRTVRGAGLMLSLDVAQADATPAEDERLAGAIFLHGIERGVIFNYPGHGARITLSFPLTSSDEEVDAALSALSDTLAEID